ncbi:transglycosylase SLT domain-containing protein [Undibacterium sp. Ren11W]|uniref:transglycosylase SLT domain-containing protein n=1 Tax=Undibacterium sp. Ren11W TaxID=3413045 RepID=UPI003BF2042C
MMSLGIIAIFLLTMMFIKPDLTEKFKNLSPYALTPSVSEQIADESSAPNLSLLMATPQQLAQTQIADTNAINELRPEETKALGSQKQQLWVTNWLAKRYRVANDASNMLVSAAYLTAKEIKLDPLLILSVMAIESGLNPFAESPVGAQGLMQVMSKIHHEKFEDMGGIKAALNPVANIRVGALILKDYVTRGGSVEAGLKMYVGAAAFDNDAGYGSRVLAEYRRLKDVATGKNVPTFVTPSIAQPQIRAIEIETDVKTNNVDNKKIAPERRMQEQVARL